MTRPELITLHDALAAIYAHLAEGHQCLKELYNKISPDQPNIPTEHITFRFLDDYVFDVDESDSDITMFEVKDNRLFGVTDNHETFEVLQWDDQTLEIFLWIISDFSNIEYVESY